VELVLGSDTNDLFAALHNARYDLRSFIKQLTGFRTQLQDDLLEGVRNQNPN
jgi:hypothetical protein